MKKKNYFILLIPLCTLLFSSCHYIKNPDERIPDFTPYIKDTDTEYLEFIAYGDAGKGSKEQQWTADEMSLYADDSANDIRFIINLGDNFYNDGVSSITDQLWNSRFEDIYDQTKLSMPFYSILGNHDYRGNIKAQIQYISPNNDRWKMPARYYSRTESLTDGTTVDFIFLDTERLFYGDAEQIAWVDDKLETSTATWTIVAGHRPLFSYGFHGFNGSLIPRLQPILKYRADIYIAGHEHNMQILGPLNDVYYIVNGAAGESKTTGVGDLTAFAAGRCGFMAFLISKDEIVCRIIEMNSGLIYNQVLKKK